jgi:HPt (histidine-containing phosphotransfer) domain-containing protein
MSNFSPGLDLDLTFLNEIADGSNEFIIESIDMFIDQTPEQLQIISTAIVEKRWPATAAAAHKLKPNLGFFGMLISQELFQEIETLAKQGDPDPELMVSKFQDAREIVLGNMRALEKVKADIQPE